MRSCRWNRCKMSNKVPGHGGLDSIWYQEWFVDTKIEIQAWMSRSNYHNSLFFDQLKCWGCEEYRLEVLSQSRWRMMTCWVGPDPKSNLRMRDSCHMICNFINYFATLFNLSTKWNKLKSSQWRLSSSETTKTVISVKLQELNLENHQKLKQC